MADDTRQQSVQQREDLSREALTVNPEQKAFTGSQWQDPKTQTIKPPENANMLAGGTEHTAGGKTPEVTFQNALPKLEDWTVFHKKPCVRDSMLTGMGSGAALGGVRLVFSAPVMSICNYAVLGFILGAPAAYQYCQYKRQAEKEGMNRVMEIMNKKDVEKKARDARREKLREDRREAKEKEQDAQFAALKDPHAAKTDGGAGKSWWKVW